ncbi:MAG TPA: TadE family protein [Vicinamibacterales bacterium]|nr:TadE family protein [Vicinamibacterales bacterium]
MTAGTRSARIRAERGTALLEMAMTLPLLLLVSVAIFELGRAYQTQQILTNAAREGARMAVLPDASPANIQARVRDYLAMGQLSNVNTATVNVTTTATMPMGAATVSASIVTVNYPFQFTVLGPVARLVSSRATIPGAFTLTAASEMRNETQF